MSVTAPQGFVAAGGSAGIKANDALDVAVVATGNGHAVPCAGVFTSNLAAAAPVQVSRAHLAATSGSAAGIVLTSGNANAATGAPGRDAAERVCGAVAGGIGASLEQVLICQTGLIGIPFPIDTVEPRLATIVDARGEGTDAGAAAARAIMTTDTVPKEVVVVGSGFTVGGMAKGAAMLAPNMATMLAVCTTDAAVDAPTLQKALQEVGCVAVMPLAAPIGSGLGIRNPYNLAIIVEQAKVPVIVDAGVGTASDAAEAMELGCDGVLMNTAIAGAKDPLAMARAMKLGIEAGRIAYLSGRIEKKLYATASSPITGIVR